MRCSICWSSAWRRSSSHLSRTRRTEMSDLIFYTHPQSRGQTVRWMLEEVGAAIRDRGPRLRIDDEGRALSVGQSDGEGPRNQAQGQGRNRSRGDLLLPRRCVPASQFGSAADRPRRLLSLDLLHLGPGRGGLQQQGCRAGNRRQSGSACSATAITTWPSTRWRRR